MLHHGCKLGHDHPVSWLVALIFQPPVGRLGANALVAEVLRASGHGTQAHLVIRPIQLLLRFLACFSFCCLLGSPPARDIRHVCPKEDMGMRVAALLPFDPDDVVQNLEGRLVLLDAVGLAVLAHGWGCCPITVFLAAS